MNNPHETRREDTLFRIYPDFSPFVTLGLQRFT
jgi:hypothetical protein